LDPLDVIGSASRWKLLELLSEGQKSVGELSASLSMSNQGVLKHLGVLIEAGLVREVRQSGDRKVAYSLRHGVFLHKYEGDDGELVVYYRGRGRASRLEPETEFRAKRLLKRFKLLLDGSY
jgi:DNA-binding transcriptional ArsR family regulator